MGATSNNLTFPTSHIIPYVVITLFITIPWVVLAGNRNKILKTFQTNKITRIKTMFCKVIIVIVETVSWRMRENIIMYI